MGFCLFEYPRSRGLYFAVNSSHVQDVVLHAEKSNGRPVCHLQLSQGTTGFEPLAVGTQAQVGELLRQAAKVGVGKAEVTLIGSARRRRVAPLLISRPDRVLLVREMAAEEFLNPEDVIVTASELFMDDGKVSQIVERPAAFAARFNAGGKIPLLRV